MPTDAVNEITAFPSAGDVLHWELCRTCYGRAVDWLAFALTARGAGDTAAPAPQRLGHVRPAARIPWSWNVTGAPGDAT